MEEYRAAARRLAEDKTDLEKSVAFVESLARGMPEMSEVSEQVQSSWRYTDKFFGTFSYISSACSVDVGKEICVFSIIKITRFKIP